MEPHDILTLYATKGLEYMVAILYLLLFVPFWRYVVNGRPAPAAERARTWSGQLADWFRLPEEALLHPAHAWARDEGPHVMTVGLDDFAQQLVGPIDAVELPALGTRLEAGQKAWTLRAGGRAVDMLAPVSGEVITLNDAVRGKGGLVNEDPYGSGWLMQVRVPDKAEGLLSGEAAKRWMARVSDELMGSLSPELGVVAQDGGLPIHGIARGIDPEHWDEIARKYLQPELVAIASE